MSPPPLSFKLALCWWAIIVGLLGWIHLAQGQGLWWLALMAEPKSVDNIGKGLLFVFLHSDAGHLIANAFALLVLGPLAFSLYPKASWRTMPFVWVGSYAAVWFLGQDGSHHLGASGFVYGLMGLLTTMGLLRRDKPSLAASMIVWFLFSGAMWAMLPSGNNVSWEGHLGGALGGLLGALLFKNLDPSPFPEIVWDDDDETNPLFHRSEVVFEDEEEDRRPDQVPPKDG